MRRKGVGQTGGSEYFRNFRSSGIWAGRTEATVCTGSAKPNNRRLKKKKNVPWFDESLFQL